MAISRIGMRLALPVARHCPGVQAATLFQRTVLSAAGFCRQTHSFSHLNRDNAKLCMLALGHVVLVLGLLKLYEMRPEVEYVDISSRKLKKYPLVFGVQVMQRKRSQNSVKCLPVVENVDVVGYRLWDVMSRKGIRPGKDKYLVAEQWNEMGVVEYSTSIPLRLLPEDTLLAIEDGKLRLSVPGFRTLFSVFGVSSLKIVGAKWADPELLAKYKDLGEWAIPTALSAGLATHIDKRGGKLFFEPEMSVNTITWVGKEGILVVPGQREIYVNGVAWSGGGRKIAKVEISVDKGETWQETCLEPGKTSGWTNWESIFRISQQSSEVWVRAKDSSGNVQPERAPSYLTGLQNNSFRKIPIRPLA